MNTGIDRTHRPLIALGATAIAVFVILSVAGELPLAAADDMLEERHYGTTVTFHDWYEFEHTRPGYDWSLPDWVEPAPDTAIRAERMVDGVKKDALFLANGHRGNFKRIVHMNWRTFEPEEGVYDTQAIVDEIARVTENGRYKFEFSFLASVWSYQRLDEHGQPREPETPYEFYSRAIEESAPRWLAKYDIARLPQVVVGSARDSSHQLTLLDEYDQNYHSRYIKAIEQLAKTGVFDHPDLINAYVHLGSESRGEEGQGPAADDEVRQAIYRERLDVWADAAGSSKAKLTTVTNDAHNLALALDLGMGYREGYNEMYLRFFARPDLGTSVTEDGYVEIDESAPLLREGRVYGGENEEYFHSSLMVERFGPLKTFENRYRESMLRMIHSRFNTYWDEHSAGIVNAALSQFAALSIGKTVDTTADAWVYLRQSNMEASHPGNVDIEVAMPLTNRNPDGSLPIKNFERWLYQRDSEDIRTVPTMKTGIDSTTAFRSDMFDYSARRTDVASGSDRIGFALDDRFAVDGAANVAIKVTYLDQGSIRWRLIYDDVAGGKVSLPMANHGTGELLTKTWILDDISFGAKERENDFFLRADAGGDLTVSFVRVVKLDPPGGGMALVDPPYVQSRSPPDRRERFHTLH